MSIFISIHRRLGIVRYYLSRNEMLIVLWLSVLLVTIGTFSYAWLEGWSLLDALYATIITMTTVGYGDLSPVTANGRLFAIFFTLIAIAIGGYAITVLAAYVIENQTNKLERTLRKRKMKRIDTLTAHMIICGVDFVGTSIAIEYKKRNTSFILIDSDAERLKEAVLWLIPEYLQSKAEMLSDLKKNDLSKYESRPLSELAELAKVPYLHDDPTDDHVLWQAGIDRAAGLAAVLPDDRDNLSIVIGARILANRFENEEMQIMARVQELRYIRKLRFAGADEVRSPAVIGGAEMALHLEHPEIGKWWYSRGGETGVDSQLVQIAVGEERPLWIGKTVAAIHADDGCMVMAVKRGDTYLSPPPADTILQKEDITITFG